LFCSEQVEQVNSDSALGSNVDDDDNPC
jgi:hypothetical protein